MKPESKHSAPQDTQPLVQHLIELRSRLIKSLVAVTLIFAGLFGFANDIYEFVAQPLQSLLPENSSMIATDVASPFLTPFKLTLLTALFLGMPYILFQIWSFIAPALYKNEKRIALPLFISSIVLFYLGVSFAYFVVFPLVFGFFTAIGPQSVAMMTDISSYLSFVIKLFFGFGFAFYLWHDASSTIQAQSSGKLMPQCAACSGASEVGVMPGWVFTSSTIRPSTPFVSSHRKSVRLTPLHPRCR